MVLPRPTGRGRAVLLVGVLLVAAAQGLRDPALLGPGIALIALVAGAAVALAVAHPRWRAERCVSPPEIGRDEEATVELRLRRRPGLAATELLDDPGSALGAVVVLAPPSERRGMVRYGVRGHRRGVFELDGLAWRADDPLGLWTSSGRVGAPATLTVWPRAASWSPEALDALADRLQARRTGEVDDALVREYRPGDDPRRIHWRSTARTGVTMVRREQQSDDPRATVVVDTRSLGGGASRIRDDQRRGGSAIPEERAAERAIEAAAGAALALLRAGVGVTVVAAGGERVVAGGRESGEQTDAAQRSVLNALAGVTTQASGWHRCVGDAIERCGRDEPVVAIVTRLDADTCAVLERATGDGFAVVVADAPSATGARSDARASADATTGRAEGDATAALRARGWRVTELTAGPAGGRPADGDHSGGVTRAAAGVRP